MKPTQPNPTLRKRAARSAVKTITVGCLYNRGNYEHVRYEICAEVGSRHSAKQTLHQLTTILSHLRPLRTPCCLRELETALAKPEDQRTTWEKEHLDQWTEAKVQFEAAKAARDAAIQQLDDLGGTAKITKPNHSYRDDNDDLF